MRWWAAPGVAPGELRALAGRALDAIGGDRQASPRGRRKRALLLPPARDSDRCLLKVTDYAALPFWRRLGPGRARHELACAARVSAAGVATPQPLAAGEQRRGLLLERCYGLARWEPDAVDLARLLAAGGVSAAERRAIAGALGAAVRALHDGGVDQDDLAPNNFLWRSTDAPRLLAVDFERARLRTRVGAAARHAALAKLDRYCANAPASLRMRVLREYCGGDRVAARAAWRAVEAASAALFAHDVRRWTRVALRSARRFAPIPVERDGARLRGYVRRGADAEAVVAALAAAAARRCATPAPARAFGVLLALAQRGLAPQPDGVALEGGALRVVFEPPAGARPLDAAAARSALVVAVDRLLALGTLDAPLAADAFLAASTPDRVWLADSGRLRPGGAWATGRRAEARRRVAALDG